MGYKAFSKEVAELIGNTDPEEISRVIDVSNSERYIFHGIKRNSGFVRRLEEGVRAQAPESRSSFWSSGSYFFGKEERGSLVTNDSTFFNYSHAQDSGNGCTDINLAIANYWDLEASGLELPPFRADECVIIPSDIPRELIHFVRIEIYRLDGVYPRSCGQIAERHLLANLLGILQSGYKPGELTTVQYNASRMD